jgi:hypothetical protein
MNFTLSSNSPAEASAPFHHLAQAAVAVISRGWANYRLPDGKFRP